MIISSIHKRRHNDYAVDASLHGYEVPLITDNADEEEIVVDGANDALLDKAMKEAQQRKQSEMRARG